MNYVVLLLLAGITGCKQSADDFSLSRTETQASASSGMGMLSASTVISVSPSTSFNSTFWSNVQTALDTGSVNIVFANGTYTRTSTLALTNLGHATNLLTLKAATTGGPVITGTIANLLDITTSQNVRVTGLKFTGGVTGYAMRVRNSQHITIDSCFFQDLPDVGYGALGVHQALTDRVLVRACTFERVGYDSHAHMIYAAYGVTRLSVVSNYFEDCSGSFVRFRGDLSDMGVVYNNDFISSGAYLTGINPVLIEIPVFNDVNPGDERMGTHFMITKNRFTYGTTGNQANRYAVVFHSSGFNPADRNYLISAADAALLHSGTVAQKRSVMSSQLGLDGNAIRFGGNTNTNVQYNVVYRCWNNYGSAGPWTGVASIGTAVNASGLATTEEAAINFYP